MTSIAAKFLAESDFFGHKDIKWFPYSKADSVFKKYHPSLPHDAVCADFVRFKNWPHEDITGDTDCTVIMAPSKDTIIVMNLDDNDGKFMTHAPHMDIEDWKDRLDDVFPFTVEGLKKLGFAYVKHK